MSKIYIETTVGLGIPLRGTLDLDELPPQLAARSKKMLTKAAEEGGRESMPDPFSADMTSYDIRIIPDSAEERQQHVQIGSDADDDVLELMDELVHELVKQKRGAAP